MTDRVAELVEQLHFTDSDEESALIVAELARLAAAWKQEAREWADASLENRASAEALAEALQQALPFMRVQQAIVAREALARYRGEK